MCLVVQALGATPSFAQAPADAASASDTTLILSVSEPSALVSIDGQVQGVTPLEGPLRLSTGHHRLELFKAGFIRLAQDIVLTSGAQTLTFTLEVEGRLGRLSASASTLPADLLVDGRNVGALPWSGELEPGEHVLRARSASAASPELRARVNAGDTTVVTLSLAPLGAHVEIDVPDTEIYVDGARVGVARWAGDVSPGKHRVQLKRTGFAAKDFEVTLAADQTWKVDNIAWEQTSLPSDVAAKPTKLDLRGLYGQIGLVGLFSRRPTDELRRDCPAAATTPGGTCHWYSSYGGGLSLRVGYSFGWVAVEGMALALADAWYDEAHYSAARSSSQTEFFGPARTEQYTFLRYGAGFGVGARLMSPTRIVRATLGVNIGLLERWERYFRIASANTRVTTPLGSSTIPDARADDSGVVTDTSALLLVDGGVLFGSTPGLKFHLGMLLAATFGSASEAPATRGSLGRDATTGARGAFGSGAIDISRGSQLFFGPVLGVQFGY